MIEEHHFFRRSNICTGTASVRACAHIYRSPKHVEKKTDEDVVTTASTSNGKTILEITIIIISAMQKEYAKIEFCSDCVSLRPPHHFLGSNRIRPRTKIELPVLATENGPTVRAADCNRQRQLRSIQQTAIKISTLLR